MRKIFSKSLLAILTFCLVLMLVACDPVEPIDNAKTAEEWGIDVNYTERKPFAWSNPDNPYDQKSENIAGVFDFEEFRPSYRRHIVLKISNTETINNLFYDYTCEDLGIEQKVHYAPEDPSYFEYNPEIVSRIEFVEDTHNSGRDIEEVRNLLREGEEVDLSTAQRLVYVYYNDHWMTGDYEEESLSEEEWLTMLDRLSKIDFVTDIYWLEGWFSTTPSGYSANNLWGMERINVREAWDYTTGSANVTVGVIDSGVRSSHVALQHAYNSEHNYFADMTDTADSAGHGTGVAGVMFAKYEQEGVYGVCHDAKFSILKTNYGRNIENAYLFIECIKYADSEGIPIVNFSGGFYTELIDDCGYIDDEYIEPMRQAIIDYEGLIIVAAGNQALNLDTSENRLYPQCFNLDNIIVVGSSDTSNSESSSSNFGAQTVDLFAPGENIKTTKATADTGTVIENGTSMSAPFVAGVAALLKSYKPSLTTAQIKEAIMNSVTPVSGLSGLCVSGGILNAQAALEYVCDHVYGENSVYIDENEHSVVCTLCGDVTVESHDSKYTSNNSTTHKLSCACGHVEKEAEAHFFIYVGLHGVMQKFECKMCGFTKLENIDVPIVRPDEIIRPIGEFVSDE